MNADIDEVMALLLNPKYVIEDQKRLRTLPQRIGTLLLELRALRAERDRGLV